MRTPIRTTLLAAAILQLLAPPASNAQDVEPNNPPAAARHLVRFAEPGLYEYRAGAAAPASPRSAAFDRQRSALAATQAAHVAAIAATLGRMPAISHRYVASRSGIAVEVDADEAARIRDLPGVIEVVADRIEYPTTFRTPAFVGADAIWSGAATPDLAGHRGEGMVVGVIDTGITPTHPSFANSGACPSDGLGDKLLSFVDCASTDAEGRCNGEDPLDHVGHGTHTASTAAGSPVAANGSSPMLAVSGIAPCAHIRAYKACPGTSCTWSGLLASMDNVLLDGDVDVLNYSIAGGTDPWNDTDRTKLDLVASGVFIAASAGNTNPSIPNPVGRVNHLGPWVTTVAATSHDVWADGLLDVAGPGAPEAGLQAMQLYKASASPNLAPRTALPIRHFDAQPVMHEGCTPGANGVPADLAPFPDGYFSGAAALLRTGSCPLQTQIDNAWLAGAELVLVRAEAIGSATQLQSEGQPGVPVYGIEVQPGEALVAFVDAAGGAATIDVQPVQGDALAAFSLRGPTPAAFDGLTKPDLAAPGVRVYAGFVPGNAYAFLDGTSMASPHVAGAAALVRSAHPDWSVAEVASALMTTAVAEGVDDAWSRHWNWDQVGNGRIDLTAAARAGLVLDESIEHYLEAEPVDGTLALGDLNRASLRDMDCAPSCTWVRELRATSPRPTRWTVAVDALTPGVEIRVEPASFELAGAGEEGAADRLFGDGFEPLRGRSQVIAVTATPPPGGAGAPAFGSVLLTDADGELPPQRLTIAVSGDGQGSGQPDIEILPASIDAAAEDDAIVTRTLVIANNDGGTLDWSRVAEQGTRTLWQQLSSGSAGVLSSHSTTQDGGVYTANDFRLQARTLLTAIEAPGIDVGGALADQARITWAIYPDAGGRPAGNPETQPGNAAWTYSSALDGPGVTVDGGTIRIDLEAAGQAPDLAPGSWWISVFPTYANAITGSAPHWKWLQAAQADRGAQLISPTLYGVTSWSPITSIGVGFTDTALRIEGRIGGIVDCAAPWLQASPSGGQLAGVGAQVVALRFDPRGLAPGVHDANVCIDSNDPDEPTVIVPVHFAVGG